jgi:predicted nucleotidyltransferase component of viral defense system
MGFILVMLKQVNKQIIEDISIELGIRPSFIEKDLYAVKLLNELLKLEYPNASLVFTGGTCLSKGYKIIKRFSEDIDFRVLTDKPFTRSQRKQFRTYIIEKVKNFPKFELLESSLLKSNESKFFSFDIKYPKEYTKDNSLRDNLKLEFSFEKTLLPTKKLRIEPIISKFIEHYEYTEVECVSLIEIGANKLSALMWRIDIKDRTQVKGSASNDPTIIRHLHDLAALEPLILDDKLKSCLNLSFELDKGRGGSNKNINIKEFAHKTLNKLKKDPYYAKEYKDFVEALSYAKENEKTGFDTALKSFERIINFI